MSKKDDSKRDKDDSNIYIGKKRSINYVMAAMMTLNTGPVKLLARGRSISRAVDVSEILINKFASGSKYGQIKITTEEITNKDGTKSNVSSIEIEILPKK